MTIRLTFLDWLRQFFVERPIMFGPKAAQRVAAAVKRIEEMPYPTPQPKGGKWPRSVGGVVQIVEGQLLTSLPPFNSNTNSYGVGYFEPQIPTFNTNTNSYILTGSDPSYSGNSEVLNRYTNNGATIASNTVITCSVRLTTNGLPVFMLLGSDC